jgi:S1-C subfamily serine protease
MSRARRLLLLVALIGLLSLATTASLLLLVDRPAARASAPAAGPRALATRTDLGRDELDTIELFRRCSPSVVYITNLAVRRDMFGMNVTEVPQGTGSGFVWDQGGYVVTNFHVIQGAQAAEVTLSDHTTWPARFVGAEPDKDLAVLKIEAPAEKLAPMALGSSNDLLVGQRVYAIGNPFGLDQTLTVGIISALKRQIRSVTNRPIQDVIQTDAAINPGNSGGPLLDSAGRLIGVNTAIYSPQGSGSVGIGFAVPVDTVNGIVPQLIRHGKVVRPGLGVVMASDAQARRFGLQGALVLHVSPDSAAEQAGIRPTRQDNYGRLFLGDVIVALDDQPVTSADEFSQLMEGRAVGDTVKLRLLRGDTPLTITVRLQALP